MAKNTPEATPFVMTGGGKVRAGMLIRTAPSALNQFPRWHQVTKVHPATDRISLKCGRSKEVDWVAEVLPASRANNLPWGASVSWFGGPQCGQEEWA